MLTTNELAVRLDAARKLMQNTRGVISLPPMNGEEKNATRGKIYEALLVQRSNPEKKGGR
jgi:hypothetical protein